MNLRGVVVPWAYDAPNQTIAGTRLRFRVNRAAPPSLSALFDLYCPQPELRFSRTAVSVVLMQQADGALVSRSQGRRLVMGLDKFSAVVFDFTGVDAVQQGFADEVFRVWALANPGIRLTVSGVTENVARMLRHVGYVASGGDQSPQF